MRGVDTRVRALPEVRRPGPTRATSVLSIGASRGETPRVAKATEDRQSMQASRTCRGPVRTHVVRGDGLAGLRKVTPSPGVMLSTSTPMVKGRRCCVRKRSARVFMPPVNRRNRRRLVVVSEMYDDNRYDTEAGPYAHTHARAHAEREERAWAAESAVGRDGRVPNGVGRSRSTESPVAATFRHLGTSRDISGRPCRQNPGRGRGGASASARGGSHRPIPREWLGGTRGDEAARPQDAPRAPAPPRTDAVLGSGRRSARREAYNQFNSPGGAAPWACSACPRRRSDRPRARVGARVPVPLARRRHGGPGVRRTGSRMSNQSPRRRRRRRPRERRGAGLTRCAPPP